MDGAPLYPQVCSDSQVYSDSDPVGEDWSVDAQLDKPGGTEVEDLPIEVIIPSEADLLISQSTPSGMRNDYFFMHQATILYKTLFYNLSQLVTEFVQCAYYNILFIATSFGHIKIWYYP